MTTSEISNPVDGPPLFGDLLALARRSWIRQMASALRERGYEDYRPSDAAIVRILLSRSVAVGQLDQALGASRQAARKVVTGLERRDYVTTGSDPLDGRRLIISLTPRGDAYARAVVEVIHTLNRRLAEQVAHDDLASARHVLHAAISLERDGGVTS